MFHMANNIRYIRLLSGRTQADFGELIGVSKDALYTYEKENIAHKLNRTRRKEVRRKFEKAITAYKIVIYRLTPFYERTDDIPTLINRKKKDNEKD